MEDESYFKQENNNTPPLGAGGLLLFNGKELQTFADLNFYDYHWRHWDASRYDPQLGRWHSPDPADQFHGISGYAYCANNPVMFTDPDGRFIPLLATAFLLFTDIGYDIQKYISPVALHIDLSFGTHSKGVGLDISVGIPQISPISYRAEVGATYYFDRIGGYGSGWQTRIGAEWGVGFGLASLKYGGTQYRDFDENGEILADQVVHRATLGIPLMNIMYENDTRESFPLLSNLPFLPSMRDMTVNGGAISSDRYRTARARARFGLFDVEMTLHTGEPTRVRNTNGITHFDGGSINDPDRSNGILSFSFGGFFRIGWDAEDIRHTFQNHFAHDFMNGGNNGSAYPWILRTRRDSRFFFQFFGF
jgi:RHS repeat-associated protein